MLRIWAISIVQCTSSIQMHRLPTHLSTTLQLFELSGEVMARSKADGYAVWTSLLTSPPKQALWHGCTMISQCLHMHFACHLA